MMTTPIDSYRSFVQGLIVDSRHATVIAHAVEGFEEYTFKHILATQPLHGEDNGGKLAYFYWHNGGHQFGPAWTWHTLHDARRRIMVSHFNKDNQIRMARFIKAMRGVWDTVRAAVPTYGTDKLTPAQKSSQILAKVSDGQHTVIVKQLDLATTAILDMVDVERARRLSDGFWGQFDDWYRSTAKDVAETAGAAAGVVAGGAGDALGKGLTALFAELSLPLIVIGGVGVYFFLRKK